ncbi:hypothetical protein ACJMK2_005000 [Sinanodonta woodiana]|uniref:Kinesin motor domain-containing protein n=1 Tax=Sinanodonta woodiana TaxID=1069815 RepID=A0ABD3VPC6_SINWO
MPQPKVNNNQNIQVAVRLRPINSIERKQGSYSVVDSNGEKKEVIIKEKLGVNPSTRTFNFDHVFPPYSKQIDLYKTIVTPIIEEVLMGYNCTIFAYGQTGTGKTFTMEGERTDDPTLTWDDDPLSGIIPRAMANIFDTLQSQEVEFSIRVSFIELYNEELFDLLGSLEDTLRLKIYEDNARKGSVIIQGLEEIVVRSKEEVYEILERGAARRQTAATLMNAHSSRSHSVFSVTIHIKENTMDGEELLKTGKLYLVDLAGSENIGRSGAVDKRAREAGNINQSLLTLGRVITALVEHAPHVPYRESKLTRLLQDSLGGRTKTSIIATISPASSCLEETLSTLDYAFRAKNITNRPEINQKLTKKALIREYTEEIEKLRKDLHAAREKNGIYLAEENYNAMHTKLTQQEESINDMTEKITAMSEELNKLLEIFKETEKNLEVTTEQLTVTTENLIKTSESLHVTKQTLRETQKDRDEHKFLVDEHVKNETSLYGQASVLLDTVQILHKDNEGLFAKIDRKKKVESHNEQSQQSFRERFRSEMDTMDNQLNQYLKTQKAYHTKNAHSLMETKQRSEQAVKSLIDSIGGLQTHLTGHLRSLHDQQEECHDALVSWTNQVLDAANTCKVEELERLDIFHGNTIQTMVTSVKSSLNTLLETHNSVMQIVEKQAEQVATQEQAWCEQQHQLYDRLSQLVFQYRDEQEKKITQLQQQLQEAQQTSNQLNKEAEIKFAELEQIFTKRNSLFTQIVQQTMDDGQDRLTSASAVQCQFSSKVEEMKSLSQTHSQSIIDSSRCTCTQTKKEMDKADNLVNGCHSLCDSSLSQAKEYHQAATKAWETHCTDLQEKCKKHHSDIKTDLDIHQNCTDGLTEECTKRCDSMVAIFKENKSLFEEDVAGIEQSLEERLQSTESMAAVFSSALVERSADVEKFIEDELKKDIPTGLTPVSKEVLYPQKLTQTDDHSILLNQYRELMKEAIEEADEEMERRDLFSIPRRQNVQSADEERDDGSDAASEKSYNSTTSGISATSGFSALSDFSKASETKENVQKPGRPIGTLRKGKTTSQKAANVNTTPRGKTKLPLKTTNTNAEAN